MQQGSIRDQWRHLELIEPQWLNHYGALGQVLPNRTGLLISLFCAWDAEDASQNAKNP